jgi:glycosyltransferase involved in cell wall biosynthesis
MRVLQVLNGKEADSAKMRADAIGAELSARGIELEQTYLFPYGRTGILAKLAGALQASRRILTGRYDAIIAYQPAASILAGVVGCLAGCRLRIAHQTAAADETRPSMRRLDRLAGALGLYSVNVASSTAAARAFGRYPRRYRDALLLIEPGVVPTRPRRTRAATLAQYGIPDGRILLNVGRLSTQKNQGLLVEALANLPGWRLVIAGDGPLRLALTALAVRRGVDDRLHLLGDVAREDVGDLLGAADVFVFPSAWESFGSAAVEAALMGVPVVAADLSVLRDVLSSDGVTAAVFAPSDDPAAWVKAIMGPMPGTGERAAMAGALTRRFSVVGMIDAYLTILAPDRDAEAGELI